MSSKLKTEVFIGNELADYIPEIARLRMEIFREWPYLYEGSLEYEHKYLAKFSRCSESVVVVAFEGEKVVGVASGMPLEFEDQMITQPFLDKAMDISQYFYFSESILKKSYRGQGIGHQFFDKRETYVRNCKKFSFICFCAIERDQNDPRKPKDYFELKSFWTKKGFEKHPDLVTDSSYTELGETVESTHQFMFWSKRL